MNTVSNDLIPGATSKYEKVVKDANEIAHKLGVSYVPTEFFIAAMLKGYGKISDLFASYGITPSTFYPKLREYLQPNYTVRGFTPRTKAALERSLGIATDYGCSFVSPEHLLKAILSMKDSYAYLIVNSLATDMTSLLNDIDGLLWDIAENDVSPNNAQKSSTTNFNSSANNVSNQSENKISEENLAVLEAFGTNLTKKASQNKLDPVIGRDKEINRVIETLTRRIKSNPILIGEPGVGKTAIVEGLANQIVKGNVPYTLKNKIVFSFDLSGIIAGAKYKGEFEERFKKALAIAEENHIILFIDEIHSMISGYSSFAIADILKPSLARGDLQVIGATTTAEYDKYIQTDPALARRFLQIRVDQPKVDDCIKILYGLKDKFEAHHGIEITDSAIKAAVVLSERYITDRFLPDKAIDLIDEAAAKERMLIDTPPETIFLKEKSLQSYQNDKRYMLSTGEDCTDIDQKIDEITKEIEQLHQAEIKRKTHDNPFIDSENIAKVVSEMTGIPSTKLTQSESQKLLNFESLLHKRVIGQEEAVNAVSRAIRRSMTIMKDPKKPIGSFIFVGPTGVGKTELSKALAEAIFANENMLIRIDMSEYMEKASVAKLIGAPPGYVGYDEEGQLTGKVKHNPYSVILFDEIEKAHPDVFNIMLQILDDGRLTDSKGKTVDFKNTIIIMTSNEGAAEVKTAPKIGFGDTETITQDAKERINEALKRRFRPEFLNRIDEIVIFRKLTMEECGKICDLQCESIRKRLLSADITLNFSADAKKLILRKGYNQEYGARPLKRAITTLIEDPLSEMIIQGDIRPDNTVTVIDDNGEIDFIVK